MKSTQSIHGFLSNRLVKLILGGKYAHLWVFMILAFCGLLTAALEGFSFYFLSEAMSGAEGCIRNQEKWIYQLIFPELTVSRMFFGSMVFSVLFQLGRSLFYYVCTVFSTRLACTIQSHIQIAVYQQILRLSYGHISRMQVGDLLEQARSPVSFVNPLMDSLNRVAISFFTILVMIPFMFFIHAKLTIFTFLIFVVLGLFNKFLFKKISGYSQSLSGSLSDVNQQTSQVLQGIKMIHAYFRQQRMLVRITKKIGLIRSLSVKMYTISNLFPCISEVTNILVVSSILLFSAILIGVDDPSFFSILITFLAVTYRLSTRVQIGASAIGTIGLYAGYIFRTNTFLKNDSKSFFSEGKAWIKEPIRNIEFRKVFFHYEEGRGVLQDISFSVPQGSVLGIVGLSGAGKTSLLDLLLQLYQPVDGAIFCNGTNIRHFSLESWLAKFGVITQDAFLFDETLEKNIRFGMESASLSDIEEVAKIAQIDSFIQGLPLGYQTIVGERGLRLSGGEKQRVTLARALLRNPEVLLLDEATSNLDSQSEHSIHSVLETMRGTKTMMIIAHRLATVRSADLILVLDKGIIIGRGTHESLLKSCERYASLWHLQTRKESHSFSI